MKIIWMVLFMMVGCTGSDDSASGGSSSTSTSSVSSSSSTPAAPQPDPSPSPTPISLDGSYHFVKHSCGEVLTYPVPVTHTLVISGDTLDVYDVVSGCDATLRQTIGYSLSYNDTQYALAAVLTKNYNNPGTCGVPVTTYTGTLNWSTKGYQLIGSFLHLNSGAVCDGNGNYGIDTYQKN